MNGETLIPAFWGGTVDTSGRDWVLDHANRLRLADRLDLFDEHLADLDAGTDIQRAYEDYLRREIGKCAAITVVTTFRALTSCLSLFPVILSLRFSRDGSLLTEAYEALSAEGKSRGTISQYLAILRRWFLWAADGDYGFCSEDAAIYALSSIPGSVAGRAVLRLDPRYGPLTDAETDRVEDALWTAARERTFDIRRTCAALLMFYLGCNPENLRRLRNRDLIPPSRPGDDFALDLPRIKKGSADKRAEFKQRMLDPELGRLIAEIVDLNRDRGGGADGPLFTMFKDDGHERYAYSAFFGRILEDVVLAFDLRSDGGEPLHLTPRRLRYSFANRCVADGVKPRQLMELLDHSDLSNLMVYFDGRLAAVTRLDRVLGAALKPIAAMYLEPTPAPWSERPWVDVSAAPLACLDCVRFRPTDPAALRRLGAALSDSVAALALRDVMGQCDDLSRRVRRALDSAAICEGVETPRQEGHGKPLDRDLTGLGVSGDD